MRFKNHHTRILPEFLNVSIQSFKYLHCQKIFYYSEYSCFVNAAKCKANAQIDELYAACVSSSIFVKINQE